MTNGDYSCPNKVKSSYAAMNIIEVKKYDPGLFTFFTYDTILFN